MPEMTGLEFLAHTKKVNPEIPAIIMSAYDNTKYILEALHLGAVTFLRKPLAISELKKWVNRVLFLVKKKMVKELLFGKFSSEKHQISISTKSLFEDDVLILLARYMSERFMMGGKVKNERKLKLDIAIHEALRNAVEHGSLELDSSLRSDSLEYDEKDKYHALLRERLGDANFAERNIHLNYSREGNQCELRIKDEGKGFDHKSIYSDSSPEKLFSYGRGMVLIRSGVDEVKHNELGNEVILIQITDD